MKDELIPVLDSQTTISIDLPAGEEFELVVSSPTGEIKTMRDTLPTVTFGHAPLSILDIPYVVEKLMSMHVASLIAVGSAVKKKP